MKMAVLKSEVGDAANKGVVPVRPTKVEEFQKVFGRYKATIDQAAPKKAIGSERTIAICSQYYAMHPELHSCDLGSMIGAVLVSSAMGLNVMLREVYFIPYSNKVQLQISYFGWIKLAKMSGVLKSINSRCVYEGDSFDPDFEASKPNHKMGPNFGDSEKVTHAYCIVEMIDGGKQMEVLPKNMIERLRMKSPMQKSGRKGPWLADYDKMAIAKVIKQALRMVPMADEWRSFTFADESITSVHGAKAAVENSEWSYEPTQEGSAEVVNDPPASEPLSEDAQNQAAYDAQMKKEADLFGGKK